MKRRSNLVVFAVAVLLFGCKSQAPQSVQAAKHSAGPADPATAGAIQGIVRFSGAPPAPTKISLAGFEVCAKGHPGKQTDDDVVVADGRLQNAFIYIKEGLADYSYPAPEGKVLLDQSGCLYSPRVVGARVGQTIAIRNSDPLMHNVHAQSFHGGGFNVGMAVEGQTIERSFAEPEVMVPIRCDIHPWMKAFVGVLPHPYFAVSAADGSFNIANVPPGDYTIEVWHEKFGRKTATVTIGPKGSKSVELTFSAP